MPPISERSEEDEAIVVVGLAARRLLENGWEVFEQELNHQIGVFTALALSAGDTNYQKGIVAGLTTAANAPRATVERMNEILAREAESERLQQEMNELKAKGIEPESFDSEKFAP